MVALSLMQPVILLRAVWCLASAFDKTMVSQQNRNVFLTEASMWLERSSPTILSKRRRSNRVKRDRHVTAVTDSASCRKMEAFIWTEVGGHNAIG